MDWNRNNRKSVIKKKANYIREKRTPLTKS